MIESASAAVITECTETITREVAGLKAMVDEFSRFARLPATRLELANLNEVVTSGGCGSMKNDWMVLR